MPADLRRLERYLTQGFSWSQLMEIGWGIEHGLTDDQIGVYAKNQFAYEQMRAYREALEQGVAVEKVAVLSKMNKLYDWEIKELLNPSREAKQREQGDHAQRAHSDATAYWKQQQVRYAAREHIDLTPYLVGGDYDWRQLKEIRLGKQLKLDVLQYANPSIAASEMKAIRENMEKEINIAPYLQNGERFNKMQIREIRTGVVKKLPVSVYAKSAFSALQMREIRYALEQGLELMVIRQYANPENSWEQMRAVYRHIARESQAENEAEDEDEWEM